MMMGVFFMVLCLISMPAAFGVSATSNNNSGLAVIGSDLTTTENVAVNASLTTASDASTSLPPAVPRRLMAIDRDNKLMSVLAARRGALRGRSPTPPTPLHLHRRVSADTSNHYSSEQQHTSQSVRMECEKNCTSNFTARASAGCMRKCATLYKVELNRGITSSGHKHLDAMPSVRRSAHDKDTNTILVDELLDTEESQSTGLYIMHPRDRYASTNVPGDTKDLNSTNNNNNNSNNNRSSNSGSITSSSSSLRNNIIENEVRQTSTEKVYSKYAASRMAAAAATAAVLASSALESGRHKRIDPAKHRIRTSLVPDRTSVEDSDLVPYQFFGQKLFASRLNDTRNQVTSPLPRKTPLSAMLIPTQAPSKLDDEEIMETSVSKQPLSWDRGKIRRFNPQNRNIVALSRKFGGSISRAEFEALTNYPLNASSSERMSVFPSLNQKRNDESIALSVAQGVPNIARLVQRESTTNKQPISMKLLDTEQIGPTAEVNATADEEETTLMPTLFIHVAEPEPVAMDLKTFTSIAFTTISSTASPLATALPSVETIASIRSVASTTFTSPPVPITTSIPVTTVSPTVTPPSATTPTTSTTTPVPTLNPNVPVHPFATPPIYHVEETPNLIEFITNTSNPLAPEPPSPTATTDIPPPTSTNKPLRTYSRLPPIFTRTTISSSVRSTYNPAMSTVASSTLSPADPTNETSLNLSSIFPNFSGMGIKIPSVPTFFANTSTRRLSGAVTSSPSDDVILQSSNNSEVTIEMYRMNMATYVLAGLGMFPVVAILLYLAKTVLYRNGTKTDGDLERYIAEEHKKISPVVRLEHSAAGVAQQQLSQPQSIYSEGSIMTEESFNRNLLKFKSLLGEGNFGQVWKAEADDLLGHMGTTRIVAVKTERCGVLNGGLRSEAAIMKKLGSHSNVVTLLGACTAKEPHLLIMEFAMRGRLLSLLRAARNASSGGNTHTNGTDIINLAPLSPRRLAGFAHDIARGMEYIAERKVVHRDLAARNILLDHNGICKICDFGMSIDLEKSQHLQPNTHRVDILRQQSSPEPNRFKFDFHRRSLNEKKSEGCKRPALPIRWMAPEALQYHIFSTETDVWAFGIVLWEISSLGCTPYPTLSGREVVRSIPNGTRPEIPADCRPELYELMSRTWRKDPRQRPTFTEARAELSRSLCQWEIDDNTSDYLDISGFSEDLEHGMVYFNRRIPEFECEI